MRTSTIVSATVGIRKVVYAKARSEWMWRMHTFPATGCLSGPLSGLCPSRAPVATMAASTRSQKVSTSALADALVPTRCCFAVSRVEHGPAGGPGWYSAPDNSSQRGLLTSGAHLLFMYLSTWLENTPDQDSSK